MTAIISKFGNNTTPPHSHNLCEGIAVYSKLNTFVEKPQTNTVHSGIMRGSDVCG